MCSIKHSSVIYLKYLAYLHRQDEFFNQVVFDDSKITVYRYHNHVDKTIFPKLILYFNVFSEKKAYNKKAKHGTEEGWHQDSNTKQALLRSHHNSRTKYGHKQARIKNLSKQPCFNISSFMTLLIQNMQNLKVQLILHKVWTHLPRQYFVLFFIFKL